MRRNDAVENRVAEMEIKLTHMEDDLKTLNDAVVRQQTHIEKLELAVERLKDRLNAQNEARGGEEIPDERPPHY